MLHFKDNKSSIIEYAIILLLATLIVGVILALIGPSLARLFFKIASY